MSNIQGWVERYWERVIVSDNQNECWQWIGPVQNRGYGYLTIKGKKWLAHRIGWVLAGESFLSWKPELLHSCDTPACVNPAHLRCGTHAENGLDAQERNRQPGKLLKVCGRGHPRTSEIYLPRTDYPTHFYCVLCARERRLEHYYRLKGSTEC